MVKRLFTCLIVMALFGACKRWTAVPEPSYIQISNYTTKVTSQQGTANQNYTDMQVIANGTTYGIFPLGAKIPVIGSGSLDFLIKAVVEINGVSALRSTYEVMKGNDTIINVKQGQVTNIMPVFQYFSNAIFPYVENFDNNGVTSNHLLIANPITDTTSHIKPYGASGKKTDNCLVLMPNSTDNYGTSMVQTKNTIGLPSGGKGIYLEFNYYGNIPISISIQGIPANGSGPTAITSCGGVYPSPSWKKAYLQLTEQVSTLQSGLYYLYFTCLYDDLVGTNYAYIDNIKIVVAG